MNLIQAAVVLHRFGPQLPKIIETIQSIEAVFGPGRGPAKREAAIALLKNSLPLVEAYAGRDLVDDELALEALGPVIDGLVAALNVIADVQAKARQDVNGVAVDGP